LWGAGGARVGLVVGAALGGLLGVFFLTQFGDY
jgi:hypothetical protein